MSFPAELADGTIVEIASKSFDEARQEVFTAADGTLYTRTNAVGGLVPYEALGTDEGENAQESSTPDAEAEALSGDLTPADEEPNPTSPTGQSTQADGEAPNPSESVEAA